MAAPRKTFDLRVVGDDQGSDDNSVIDLKAEQLNAVALAYLGAHTKSAAEFFDFMKQFENTKYAMEFLAKCLAEFKTPFTISTADRKKIIQLAARCTKPELLERLDIDRVVDVLVTPFYALNQVINNPFINCSGYGQDVDIFDPTKKGAYYLEFNVFNHHQKFYLQNLEQQYLFAQQALVVTNNKIRGQVFRFVPFDEGVMRMSWVIATRTVVRQFDPFLAVRNTVGGPPHQTNLGRTSNQIKLIADVDRKIDRALDMLEQLCKEMNIRVPDSTSHGGLSNSWYYFVYNLSIGFREEYFLPFLALLDEIKEEGRSIVAKETDYFVAQDIKKYNDTKSDEWNVIGNGVFKANVSFDKGPGRPLVVATQAMLQTPPVLAYGSSARTAYEFLGCARQAHDARPEFVSASKLFTGMIAIGPKCELYCLAVNMLSEKEESFKIKQYVKDESGKDTTETEVRTVQKFTSRNGTTKVVASVAGAIPFNTTTPLATYGKSMGNFTYVHISGFSTGEDPTVNVKRFMTLMKAKKGICTCEYEILGYLPLVSLLLFCEELGLGFQIFRSHIIDSSHVVLMFGELNKTMTRTDVMNWKASNVKAMVYAAIAHRELLYYGMLPRITTGFGWTSEGHIKTLGISLAIAHMHKQIVNRKDGASGNDVQATDKVIGEEVAKMELGEPMEAEVVEDKASEEPPRKKASTKKTAKGSKKV